MLRKTWLLLVAVTVLAGCNSQDDSDTAPASSPDTAAAESAPEASSSEQSGAAERPVEELSREDLRAMADDPEAMQELMRDPERRTALRERMRELRRERTDDPERQERREAIRERAEAFRRGEGESGDGQALRRGSRAPWWEDESIAGALELSDEQTAQIAEAHEALQATARQSRQELVQAAENLREALQADDRERLEALIDSRVAALDARARAEAEWMRQLLDTLDEAQMRKLAEERPELLPKLLSPTR
ncbi:Spy/CpxP family protein refolding chaperone [Wenzhouxiangella sp. EGI_FJ10409]|uniref:Spy/CpxP family protein refolding chaperone n=1 Tax=Wenzhouxiangella sp. EGI_FJ10409 TaxID=3243767 RepID=UPI0035D8175F